MPQKYPGATEVIPGVFIDFDGKTPAIYITDASGEIVTWNYDEVKEDPGAWTASLMAMLLAGKLGTAANRDVVANHADPFEMLHPSAGTVIDQLVGPGKISTRAYARRMVMQGQVSINGAIDINIERTVKAGDAIRIANYGTPFKATKL
jgi:ribosome-associated protein YbcJ (S4-like RNA binding protein)